MFWKMSSELQCVEGLGQNTNVWKDRARIPMFERIGQEFQCFQG